MKKLTIIIIASIAIVVLSLFLYPILLNSPQFSPQENQICTTSPQPIIQEADFTGSEIYELQTETNNGENLAQKCVSSEQYAPSLRSAVAKAKQNAQTICENAPAKISCDEPCSPKFTQQVICTAKAETTELKAEQIQGENKIKCEIVANAKAQGPALAQCT